MKIYEAKGKTKEEAINLGLSELGVTISDVNIEVIDEGKKGVFGSALGSRPVIVRLTVKEEDDVDILSEVFSPAKPVFGQKSLKAEVKVDSKPEAQQKIEAKPKAETKPAPKARTQLKTEPQKESKPKTDPKPKSSAPKTEEKTVKPHSDAPQLSNDELEVKACEFLTNITHLMGVDVTIHMERDEENNIRVGMFGDTLGILIGRRGETLDALQYLTSLYMNRGQDEYTRITLDTENYRAKREEALVRLANRMANRAIKTGRKVVLEPMNPYERRILHSALQSNEAVTTHSEGEEPNRHVVITLK